MTNEQFMECDTCRAKLGSPSLCAGCLHNRGEIERLQRMLQIKEGRIAGLMRDLNGDSAAAEPRAAQYPGNATVAGWLEEMHDAAQPEDQPTLLLAARLIRSCE